MKLDDERLGKYLDEIAAETIDIEKIIGLNDFRMFVNEIRKIIKEDCEVAKEKE